MIGRVRLLILGGTMFAGRAVAEAALGLGWDVTAFNRGRSGSDVRGVKTIRGDRQNTADLSRLARFGDWDAVVDSSAYIPSEALRVAEALRPVVTRYVLLSTVSVYRDWPVLPLSERSEVLSCPADAGAEFGPDDVEDGPTRYGYLKSGCEVAVRHVFGDDSSTILRPGVVLGPGEYVGRLPWWLGRVAAGGRVLAPGHPDRFIQPVDVRDLANFALIAARGRVSGVYNVTAPSQRDTFGELLAACADVTNSDVEFTWVADELLLQLGVRQWSELPLWRTYDGVWRVDSTRAIHAGLASRALLETVRDTWSWMLADGTGEHGRALEIGLTKQQELAVLAATERG